MARYRLSRDLLGDVTVMEPVSVFEALAFQKHAAAVVTDSGCIQEEAYLLGVPCVTVRENTERHLTVVNGANRVTGFAPATMRAGVRWALALENKEWPNTYGHPVAGARIVQRIGEPHSAAPAAALSFA
jgi:UDP-N-acetylglucosamine 2-epimerase